MSPAAPFGAAAGVRRLAALAPLDGPAHAALAASIERSRMVERRREFVKEGAPLAEPLLLLEGWAARIRHLPDGRRQIIGFLLPGELIGQLRHPAFPASATVVAVSDVLLCPAPPAAGALAEAYAVSQVLDEANLFAQVVRLGRMSAEERVLDLLLELGERLSIIDPSARQSFVAPLTQEMLADATGLTAVHINRVLQELRRRGAIDWKHKRIAFANAGALARGIGRAPIPALWMH